MPRNQPSTSLAFSIATSATTTAIIAAPGANRRIVITGLHLVSTDQPGIMTFEDGAGNNRILTLPDTATGDFTRLVCNWRAADNSSGFNMGTNQSFRFVSAGAGACSGIVEYYIESLAP